MSEYVLTRIEIIQQELEQLKKTIAHQTTDQKRKTKLKGLWKGVEVSEEDIEEAKRALFKLPLNSLFLRQC